MQLPEIPPAEDAAGRILFARHTPAGHNQYGACDVAGYRLDAGPDGKVRVSHRTPAPDLLDPWRLTSDELAAEQRRLVNAYAATLIEADWTVERRGPHSRRPYLLTTPPADEWQHGDVVLDTRGQIWTRANAKDQADGYPWASGADITFTHGEPYAPEGGYPEETPVRPLTLLVRHGKPAAAREA